MAEGVVEGGKRLLPFHYGWVIVGTGTATIFAALGLGRFALGMLLPSMGADLGLSPAEMGWIGTGNFVGYLAAVLAAGWLVRRLGARRMIALALALVGLSMLLVGRADGFAAVMLLYVLTGLGSGGANVPVMGLVPHWFGRRKRGKAAGYIVIGSGFAIVFSGLAVPAINAAVGGEGWRVSWTVLGGLALAVALLAYGLLRDRPAEMGLDPIDAPAPASAAAQSHAAPPPPPASLRRLTFHLGGVYALFGFGYVIYATFLVTTLVHERGFAEASAGQAWGWIGFLSLFSGPVLGGVSDRVGRKAALAVVFAFQATAYLLIASDLPEAFVYLSIALYGLVAWAVPGIMAAAVGDYAGPERAAGVFGSITFLFGIGQICGPALAGQLAEILGGFGPGYVAAAVAAILGLLLTLALPRPHAH